MFKKRFKLASITAGFSKVLADLEALRAQNQAQIAKHNTEITDLKSKAATLQDEHDQAAVIHKNLTTLLTAK